MGYWLGKTIWRQVLLIFKSGLLGQYTGTPRSAGLFLYDLAFATRVSND